MAVSDCDRIAEIEEDVRAEDGSDDSANTVESLGNVDAELRISWRTTNCDTACQPWQRSLYKKIYR